MVLVNRWCAGDENKIGANARLSAHNNLDAACFFWGGEAKRVLSVLDGVDSSGQILSRSRLFTPQLWARAVYQSYGAWRRWSLWALLLMLITAMFILLVWLSARYEASQLQLRLDRYTAEVNADIRAALARNVQSMQAIHADSSDPLIWQLKAAELLKSQRELVRLELRDQQMRVLDFAQSPYRPTPGSWPPSDDARSDMTLTCAKAFKQDSPAYTKSYYQSRTDGLGVELLELCMPVITAGQAQGFVIATYSLRSILIELIKDNYQHQHEISFTEIDGTRLAAVGKPQRGARHFTARQVLDLPGNTLMLQMDSWHTTPSLFPNVLTALVAGMALVLLTVVMVLVRDNRRRLQAERDLGEALAFRKAMEDSLVTGLRARDLQGNTTYVNPAFCQLVGFEPHELLGQSMPAPYWPPELADEYSQRQAIRFAGHVPPRQGFESVFMHKNGTRFPVLIIEAPLINAHGQHSGWMSAFLDISEQRKAEELARASEERLQATARLATVGEMASLLSHELNQPLAAIASYATGSVNLLEGAAQDIQQQTLWLDVRVGLQQIKAQADRAGKVIKSVHDFVRRRDRDRLPVSAAQLLEAIQPLMHLQARKMGVRLITHLEPHLPLIVCDRTMVEQVLLNLARNGMQAMEGSDMPSRTLTLRVQRAACNAQQSWVEFSVVDTGVGISAEIAQKLFQPFFTTRDEGMGLGLSLCRTVVEQHGGVLQAAPHMPQGTVFRFTLPALVETEGM